MKKNSAFKKKLLIIFWVFWGEPAFADNRATELEAPTVEVIGTTPLPGLGTPLNQVPSNVQSATGRDIQKQQSLTLSDYANANLGSVNINDTLVNPFQLNVNFRGFTASPLLGTPQGISVFQDGVRINEPFGDLVNWDLIPQSAISSINLIPGSNPLFGLNTLGGALAIHTKSGFEYPGFAIQSYGGSFGRGAAEFEVGGHGENVDYFVTANVFREEGFREHSNSDVNQFFSKFGWQDEKSDLDLSLTAAKNKLFGTQPLPISLLDNPAQAFTYPDFNDNRLIFLNLKGSHFLSDTVLLASNVYYRESKTLSFNSNVSDDFDNTMPVGPGNMPASNVFSDNDQIGYGGAVQLTLLGDLINRKNQFTAGASIDHGSSEFSQMSQEANLTADRRTVGTSPFTTFTDVMGSNTYYGLYATDTFSLTKKLHFTASGRYNIAQINLEDQLGTALNGNNQFTRFNPAAGVAYNPVKTLTLYGGYNEGTRAPTPVELTCADPGAPCQLPNSFLSDPPLKQVVSKTWEAGMRGQWQRLSWNAALFRTKSQDDIQFLSSGGF
ncbi:MAG: TonB-dependent receptor, partial [Burkholderiales bacterium]